MFYFILKTNDELYKLTAPFLCPECQENNIKTVDLFILTCCSSIFTMDLIDNVTKTDCCFTLWYFSTLRVKQQSIVLSRFSMSLKKLSFSNAKRALNFRTKVITTAIKLNEIFLQLISTSWSCTVCKLHYFTLLLLFKDSHCVKVTSIHLLLKRLSFYMTSV